jgi:hypothetical protein
MSEVGEKDRESMKVGAMGEEGDIDLSGVGV